MSWNELERALSWNAAPPSSVQRHANVTMRSERLEGA